MGTQNVSISDLDDEAEVGLIKKEMA